LDLAVVAEGCLKRTGQKSGGTAHLARVAEQRPLSDLAPQGFNVKFEHFPGSASVAGACPPTAPLTPPGSCHPLTRHDNRPVPGPRPPRGERAHPLPAAAVHRDAAATTPGRPGGATP